MTHYNRDRFPKPNGLIEGYWLHKKSDPKKMPNKCPNDGLDLYSEVKRIINQRYDLMKVYCDICDFTYNYYLDYMDDPTRDYR